MIEVDQVADGNKAEVDKVRDPHVLMLSTSRGGIGTVHEGSDIDSGLVT